MTGAISAPLADMSEKVFTHCRYCVSLCGVTVTVSDDGRVVESIEPDRENPYTWRDFCRKGRTAAERVEHPRRITQPMRRVGEQWVTATYEEAISDIAARLTRIIERDGADAVGSYAGNPLAFNFGGMTFLNALLDAIGSGNRYYVTSVDTNANHVVTEAMYGSEFFPLTCDIDEAQCFLLIGMDPAVSKWGWIDNAPAAWQRITERERRGDADVIVVDPRRSATAEQATTHVAIRPGGDWAFLLGVLKVIFEEGRDRRAYAVDLGGVDNVRELAGSADLAELSARCGIAVDTIQDVARRFADAPTAFCNTHTGVSHTGTAGGTVAEWLGQVLNAVTNRLDVPGGRRFERGYVDVVRMWAMLAPKTKHRSRLRDLPAITGYHALGELPDEIRTPGPGQVRAMLITAGNPVTSGPDGDALDEALGTLELLVAVDLVQRESHRHADWLIPAEHWLERDELALVTGSLQEYPYVQYGYRAIDRPASVMPEWKFYADLALAMKRPLFGVRGVNTAIRMSRWLSKRLDRPSLELGPHAVEALMVATGRRVKLRDIKARPHGWRYADKRYGDMRRALRTPDKRVDGSAARVGDT